MKLNENILRNMAGEIIKRAIIEYIGKPEEKDFEITTKDLLEELGDDFRKSLSELSFEKAAKGFEKMRL